eukprot:TRINITY_DN23404_c0_g1_i1.p1 TRINITY_DN23404_c0_g1~~TRINITY_DN23404_c0_g1_i1.p1  ORF type:complete len:193 (-),score=30.39 TRINITY_DN23404_c0_g1_i1:24-581(-)
MAESLFIEHTAEVVKPHHRRTIAIVTASVNSFILLAVQTVFSLGVWNFLDNWAWPYWDSNGVKDILYILIGVTLKIIGEVWFPEEERTHLTIVEWTLGRPASFGLRRKAVNFGVYYLHYMGFLFAWVGFWNLFDLYVYDCGYCWERELVYMGATPVFLFLVQEGLSMESLYWLASRQNKRDALEV